MSMSEPKSYARSVRMTDTVYSFVMEHVGNGFNQKFENIILHYKQDEAGLDARLKEKKAQLAKLQAKIEEKQAILLDIDSLQREVKRILQKAESLKA